MRQPPRDVAGTEERPPEDPELLGALLGHRFRDPMLLHAALTHPSRSHEEGEGPGNERLEFLGDAVLDLVVAELLFGAQPTWREGELTRARAALVNSRALAARARALGLGRFARLGRTELRSGGANKDSILANLFEAVVGALYLDGGLEACRALARRVFGPELAEAVRVLERDPKTRLQEWAHAHLHQTPVYHLVSDSGTEADETRFGVEVWIADQPQGRGAARTKRAAERAAAQAALRQLDRGDD